MIESAGSGLAGRRVLVVFNPKSGSGDSGLPEFVGHLLAGGAEVTERALEPDRPMEAHVEDLEGFQALVAAGGDGTVSGLAYAARNRGVPLLAYPAGTANLIAQNLGMPTDPEALARVAAAGHALEIDLGELEVGGQRRGFAMLAGAGLDASMIADSEELKGRMGALGYVAGLLRHVNPKTTTFRLTLDGQPLAFEGAGVMAANFGMINFRIPLTADISPYDGRLTVVLVKAGNLAQLLPNLIDSVRARLNLGDPAAKGAIETLEAREIRVEADEPFPVQYDGEVCEHPTPFTARVLPRAVAFLTDRPKSEVKT